MSGGPYGRGKAPERACMKVENWPELDQRVWRAAMNPGDIFDDAGERAQHRAISNRHAEKGYGRWLTFLEPRLARPPSSRAASGSSAAPSTS